MKNNITLLFLKKQLIIIPLSSSIKGFFHQNAFVSLLIEFLSKTIIFAQLLNVNRPTK